MTNLPERRRRGFTLIEVMVVILLIGIMSAMIIGEMRGTYEDALLRSTGRQLVSVCNLASSRAVTVNQLHRVRLDTAAGRYTLERRSREEEGVGGFVPAREILGGEGELDKRITVEVRDSGQEALAAGGRRTSAVAGGESEAQDSFLVFYADGTADSREVILRDRDGFGLALRVNATTARVRIVELERQ